MDVSETSSQLAGLGAGFVRAADRGQQMAVGSLPVLITLGAVIRGDTPISMWWWRKSAGHCGGGADTAVPVIFGVLTTDTMQQVRSGRASKQSRLSYGRSPGDGQPDEGALPQVA